jgi:hypothetical protein
MEIGKLRPTKAANSQSVRPFGRWVGKEQNQLSDTLGTRLQSVAKNCGMLAHPFALFAK